MSIPACTDDCPPFSVYFITAPSHVTPNMLYQMSVSLLKMYYKSVVVTAYIRRNNAEEIASTAHTFEKEGTTMMQMQVGFLLMGPGWVHIFIIHIWLQLHTWLV